MRYSNIARIIDHTNINKNATKEDILKTCEQAKEYNFRAVCVRLNWAKLTSKELQGSKIKTVVLIDPPIGISSSQEKIKMCQKAKKDGADEIDVVMNLIDIKYEKWNKILKELKTICKILPTKVIIGSGYLTDEEIKKVSQLVKQAGAICVKTATEKDPLENRELEEKAIHLKLMREYAPGLLIKAAGAIRTLKDARKMIKAGADIIGTSSGVEIMKQI